MPKKKLSPQQPSLLKRQIPQMPEGYYSSGPNPNLRRFVEEHATPYDPETDNYKVKPFDKPITTTKATSIYNMHTYWSKKPHDAIREYIKHYTKPGDIVTSIELIRSTEGEKGQQIKNVQIFREARNLSTVRPEQGSDPSSVRPERDQSSTVRPERSAIGTKSKGGEDSARPERDQPSTVRPERSAAKSKGGEHSVRSERSDSPSVRSERSETESKRNGTLSQLQQTARDRKNIFASLMEAVKYNSLGQISHALYEVGGEYRRNM